MNYPGPKPKWLAGGRIRRTGIYWLPNAITTMALFAGFYAVVQAMNARFELAAIGILVAMLLDGMDGRVARWTHTQSPFGAELDSLSDMVSFGAAPALVIYEFMLKGMGKLGWVAAFVYCACAALRLARFNTNIDIVDKRYFQGLPSPAAAGIIAGFIWTVESFDVPPMEWRWVGWGLALFAGLTMVTSIKFWSGKDINLRRSVPFWVIVAIALFMVVLLQLDSNLPELIFLLFLMYGLSGYLLWMIQYFRRGRDTIPGEEQ